MKYDRFGYIMFSVDMFIQIGYLMIFFFHFSYFFITPCEEFGMRAVQEEVTDDGQVLPLWEGKVDARIKAIK